MASSPATLTTTDSHANSPAVAAVRPYVIWIAPSSCFWHADAPSADAQGSTPHGALPHPAPHGTSPSPQKREQKGARPLPDATTTSPPSVARGPLAVTLESVGSSYAVTKSDVAHQASVPDEMVTFHEWPRPTPSSADAQVISVPGVLTAHPRA